MTIIYIVPSSLSLSFDDEERIVFAEWLTDERHLALFPAGTIIRDSHHRKSQTRRKQGLKLRRT